MDYLFFALVIFAAIHSYSFAQWLKRNGNTLGAVTVYTLIAVSFALPIYQFVTKK